jgi:hypothetical protein
MAGFAGACMLIASCLFTACPEEVTDDGPDKSGLAAKITGAEANRDSVEVSVTGDGTDVEIGKRWVTIEAKNDYNVAIASAKKVQYNGGATQGQVDQAIADIDAATGVFDPLKKDGLNPNTNTRSLRIAIFNAENLVKATSVSASGIEYSPAAYWVTSAEMDAFRTAITAAKDATHDVNKNQLELDMAASTLDAAAARFGALRKTGIKPDKTALNAAITGAQANRDSTEVSVDGSDVAVGKQWVTQAVTDAYSAAIRAAELVYRKPANDATILQPQVDDAKAGLDTATGIFNAAKQPGTRQ